MSIWLPLAAAGVALHATLPAHRSSGAVVRGCEVAIEPADVDPDWQEAIREVRAWLSDPSRRDIDCGGIEVRAGGLPTSVVFTTTDGRRAQRPIPSPDQLLAVVEALTTTVPESSPTSLAPDPGVEATAKPDSIDRPTPAARASGSSDKVPTRIVIDGRLGTRVLQPTPCSSSSGTTCAFAALSLGVGVGLSAGPWELGVAGESEPIHATLSGVPPSGFTMSAYAVGLWAGRRAAIGSVDAVAGATAAIVLTNESNEDSNGQQQGSQNQDALFHAEPRVGVYAGLVVPCRSHLCVRPQLAFDVMASHIGSTYSPENNFPLPALPWWSAAASVGVDWEAP